MEQTIFDKAKKLGEAIDVIRKQIYGLSILASISRSSGPLYLMSSDPMSFALKIPVPDFVKDQVLRALEKKYNEDLESLQEKLNNL